MRHRVLALWASFITRRPVLVLLVGCLLTLGALQQSAQLKLRPSRLDMVPKDDPEVHAWREFTQEFDGLYTILILLKGPAADMRAFADAAYGELAKEHNQIRSVTYKVDVERLKSQALYLLDHKQLVETKKDLVDLGAFLHDLVPNPTVANLYASLAANLADDAEAPKDAAQTGQGLDFIRDSLRAVGSAFRGAMQMDRVFPSLDVRRQPGVHVTIDNLGYMVSQRRDRQLLVLSPRTDLRDSDATRVLLQAVQRRLDPVARRFPTVEWTSTGDPVRAVEEEDIVRRDMQVTALLAGLGGVVLCRIAFQGILPAILLTVCLWLSVVYCTGLTNLLLGHLNLIGAVFIPLLLGLGEDFGNYILMTYQDSTAGEGPEPMATAVTVAGRGMVLGALTTAVVFYSLMFHPVPAFREMGFICGNGILLAMASMLTLLPAVIVLRLKFVKPFPPRSAEPLRFPLMAKVLLALQKPRRTILALALILTVLAHRALGTITFDYNMTNMLSQSATAVAQERVLREEFGLGTEFAVACGTRLEDMHRIAEALKASPIIGEVDSLARVIPSDVEGKRPLVESIAGWARSFPRPALVKPATTEVLLSALERLNGALARPRKLAAMLESEPLKQKIKDLEREIANTATLVRHAAPEVQQIALQRVQAAMVHEVNEFLSILAAAGRVPPYTLATIPEDLRRRYVSPRGRLAAFISPAQELSTETASRAFYEQVKALERIELSSSPGEPPRHVGTAGVPQIVYRMMSLIQSGFNRSALIGVVACLLMVWFDFRRLDLALLAMLPVACGAIWMIGIMALLGLKWNSLDSISIPIFPGIAVAFSVNIIHRALVERNLTVALASTGRAAVYSAYTTIVGFAALLAAHHRGLASFGLVMSVGIATNILAAVTVMPIVFRYCNEDSTSEKG